MGRVQYLLLNLLSSNLCLSSHGVCGLLVRIDLSSDLDLPLLHCVELARELQVLSAVLVALLLVHYGPQLCQLVLKVACFFVQLVLRLFGLLLCGVTLKTNPDEFIQGYIFDGSVDSLNSSQTQDIDLPGFPTNGFDPAFQTQDQFVNSGVTGRTHQ